MIHSVDEPLLVTLIPAVPWLRCGNRAGGVPDWVSSPRIVPGLLACGSTVRTNHWAGPGINARATRASPIASDFYAVWDRTRLDRQILRKAFPTTAAPS